MSSRVFATALRRAATMARPTVMAAARPAAKQSFIKAATVRSFEYFAFICAC